MTGRMHVSCRHAEDRMELPTYLPVAVHCAHLRARMMLIQINLTCAMGITYSIARHRGPGLLASYTNADGF